MTLKWSVRILSQILIWTSVCLAQNFQCPTNASTTVAGSFTALHEFFPDVEIVHHAGTPSHGGQNFTYCCALAVDSFLSHGCVSTSDVEVQGLTTNSQFPCGAQWNGDNNGAPLVRVSYQWTEANCPGWQISAVNNPNQWLQSLVAFILPAVVFCLSIPRRRQLTVWHRLFPDEYFNYRTIITATVGSVIAMAIVAVDTVAWLLTTFTAAGPILLSGLYEARLDKRVVSFITKKEKCGRIPPALRARILLAVLCGNLDLFPAFCDSMALASSLDLLERPLSINKEPSTEANFSSENKPSLVVEKVDSSTYVSNDGNVVDRKSIVSARLTALLTCQYPFGPTIGASILFYVGAFAYSLLEIRQAEGSSDIAYALSFGMWWMVIPHMAVVAGFLLGGNNPNFLEGTVGAAGPDYRIGGDRDISRAARRASTFVSYNETRHERNLYSRIFGRVYEAAYKPAWIWNRGSSKQSWLLVLCADSLTKYRERGELFDKDIKPSIEQLLSEIIITSPLEWVWLAGTALSLIFIPCLFAFLLSFFTPQIGIGCRSLTFTVYLSAQTLLTILWTIRITLRNKYWCQGLRIERALPKNRAGRTHDQADKSLWREVAALQRMAEDDTLHPPSSPDNASHISRKTSMRFKIANVAYHFFLWTGFGAAIFSAIGGTIMQLLGVYRNDICKMRVSHWLPGHHSGILLQLSSNSAQSILEANGTWTILGSLSIAVLIVCCYNGWWYQRRLRRQFRIAALNLDPTPRRVDTR